MIYSATEPPSTVNLALSKLPTDSWVEFKGARWFYSRMNTEDFSLKWFGVPDAEMVAFWKTLDALPKGVPHRPDNPNCYCRMCAKKDAYMRMREDGAYSVPRFV